MFNNWFFALFSLIVGPNRLNNVMGLDTHWLWNQRNFRLDCVERGSVARNFRPGCVEVGDVAFRKMKCQPEAANWKFKCREELILHCWCGVVLCQCKQNAVKGCA